MSRSTRVCPLLTCLLGATLAACGEKATYDADGDGYTVATDCDDGDASVNPGATEGCDQLDDGLDNDCDGAADGDDPDPAGAATVYEDADGDGYGDDATQHPACAAGRGVASVGGDCDDGESRTWPGAVETCDGADNDCDGVADEEAEDKPGWWPDADADGFGDARADLVQACDSDSQGLVNDDTDCNDRDPAINPRAVEICDGGVDNDCDAATDETQETATAWVDADGDTWPEADAVPASLSCEETGPPAGYTSRAPDPLADCDDDDDATWPGAPEPCADGVDRNCDGLTGGEDHDGDGAPGCGSSGVGDCDDADPARAPGAEELCDEIDNDCDGLANEAGATGEVPWYTDADGDTWGDPALSVTACENPGGCSRSGEDCDDGDDQTNPGATETCDGADQDCDDEVDEGLTGTWYTDADEDGYGDDATARADSCVAEGEVSQGGDCDDEDAAVWEGCDAPRSGEIALEAVSCAGSGDTGAPEDDGIYRIYGDDSVDDDAHIGQSVDGGQDWDGDGISDLAVGVPGADTWYILSGDPGGDVFLGLSAGAESGAGCDEADRSGSAILASGEALRSTYDGAGAGAQVVTLGGVDGPVLAVGVPGYDSSRGAVLLVQPGAEATPAVLTGPGGTLAGYALANAGDMDRDGQEDLFIGSYASSGDPAVWVRYETAAGGALGDSDSLTDAWPRGSGYYGDCLGSAGDVDGNGTSDLLVGTDRSGAIYLVLADASGTAGDVSYDAPLGYYRAVSTSWTGACPGPAGDLNADGYDDFVVGVPEVPAGGGALAYGGAAYVVLGGIEGGGSFGYDTTCGTELEACADLTIEGASATDFLGYFMGTAGSGDLTGDGVSDLVLGAPAEIYAERATSPGAVHVFAGSADDATFAGGTLSTEDATFSLVGDESGMQTGYSRAIVPDLDGDACDELVVGGLGYSDGSDTRALSGRAWLISGCR